MTILNKRSAQYTIKRRLSRCFTDRAVLLQVGAAAEFNCPVRRGAETLQASVCAQSMLDSHLVMRSKWRTIASVDQTARQAV